MAASFTRTRIILFILVALAIGGIYIFLHRGEEYSDDASIEAHVVTISPKVAGYVKNLLIQDNQSVKAGDVLLQIDPRDYIIKRDQALAALEAAKAGHTASNRTLETTEISAPSNLTAAQSQVDAAQANWQKALNDLRRMQRLSDEARSREQLDQAVAVEKTARSTLEDAKAKLRSAKTAPKVIASARSNAEQRAAQIKQAEAELEQAEKDLADTKIIAPMDGRITRRGVEQGDYVQTGEQLGYIVSNDIWVIANYKETQLTHMKIGDRISIHVDAYPKEKLEGKVDSIQAGTGSRFSTFPAENATGNFVKIVQRVPVKILLTHPAAPSLPLGPGMSVETTAYTQ